MKLQLVAPLVAVAALVGARFARDDAKARAVDVEDADPYAPSPAAAPFVSLGYRELAADLLFVRLVGYFGSEVNDAAGLAALTEAVTTLDPAFRRPYEFGAVAMTAARHGVENSIHLRAINVLAQAQAQFPHEWRYPKLAGEIYLVDLQTSDPALRRSWDEKGMQLLEAASRKPTAPAELALFAVGLQTKLGQHQRAVDTLRETLLLTDDTKARAQLIAKLAELEKSDADEIGAELVIARRQFDTAWLADRPALPANYYVLVGKPLAPTFDLRDLATGGRDVVGTEGFDRRSSPPSPPSPASSPESPALPAALP